MAVQSKLVDILPTHYGCVVFTAVGSLLVNHWMVFNVMRARKQYSVKVNCSVLTLFLLTFFRTAFSFTDVDLAHIFCTNDCLFSLIFLWFLPRDAMHPRY